MGVASERFSGIQDFHPEESLQSLDSSNDKQLNYTSLGTGNLSFLNAHFALSSYSVCLVKTCYSFVIFVVSGQSLCNLLESSEKKLLVNVALITGSRSKP